MTPDSGGLREAATADSIRGMTSLEEPGEEVLLVAIVEMAPGHAGAGQQYEDAVLGWLGRHGGSVERRLRTADGGTEVQVLRFATRAGLEAAVRDPDRLAYRERLGDAVPTTRVLEVGDVLPTSG